MNPLQVKKVYFNTLSNVINSLVLVTPPDAEKNVRYIRLEENPFVLSTEVDQHTQVVTAHKLSQYLNPKYSVRLDESVECWLDWFIESGEERLE